MDYFSELLESYSKLKKRTFKLTYISEETSEEEYVQAAQVVKDFLTNNLADIQAANFSNKIDLQTPAGVSISFWSGPGKSTGRVGAEAQSQDTQVIKAQSGAPFGEVAVINGGSVEISSQLTSKGAQYKQFLSKFIQGGDSGSKDAGQRIQQGAKDAEQQKQQQELEAQQAADEQRKQELREIGGWSRQNGVELSPGTIAALQGGKEAAQRYCDAAGDSEAYKGFCAKIWSYFAAGTQKVGLEYKLATAQGVSITDADEGTTKKVQLSPGTMEAAAESAQFLVSFLDPESDNTEEKCKEVKNRIGMYQGKKLVLFGQEPSNNSEAVVVGEPNALQRLALDRVEKECGMSTADLTQLTGDGVSTNTKNAVRGTFFEEIIKFAGNYRNAQTPEEKMAAGEALREVLKEKRATLIAIARETDPQSGADLDSEYERDIQEQILSVLDDPSKLSKFIMGEVKAIQPVIDFLDADEVVHVGTSSKTGERADVYFMYNDEAKAREKAEAVGSTVEKMPDGRFRIAAGLKRLQEMHGPKLGEINSQERLDGIATGKVVDRFIAPGFFQSMNIRQFGRNNGEGQEEMIAYADELESEVSQATSQLLEQRLSISPEGKLRSQKPSDVFGALATTTFESLTPAQVRNSVLGKALFKTNAEGNLEQKRFDGDDPIASENRQRGHEMIGRAVRMNKLKNDVESGNPAARAYAIRLALVTGSNSTDQSQVMVDDKGETLVLKHNEIFKLICDAERSDNPPEFKFSESGYSITINEPGKPPLSLRVGQEMSKVIDSDGNFVSCATRTDCKIPTASARDPRLQGNLSESNNESTFHRFLKGQMNLLEELLNSSK